MNPAYISAISALCGSAIGALAALGTSWLTQRYQEVSRRRAQENLRLERLFVEFIDLASRAFVDALLQTSIQEPSKLVQLYATMGKLRLFASEPTVQAADKVMGQIVETYYTPKVDLQTKPAVDKRFDILHEFADSCRAELQARFTGRP